jgi:hypothetical protein
VTATIDLVRPRILSAPPAVSSSGDEISDFAARFGLVLVPWQRLALRTAMAERADGRWAAGRVAIIVPRQNGKGTIIEARELGGLFLLGEKIITHTAHEFKTAQDAFRRIRTIIDGSDELSRRVKSIIKVPNPTIELMNGNRLTFVARSGGSGRGFAGDVVILDEAYDLTTDQMDALLPTLTTAQYLQVWYTSSAGKAHSEVLAKVRQQGLEGSPTLAYMEWSVEEPGPDDPPLDLEDRALLARANPGYPDLVTEEYLAVEAEGLTEAGRLRERFGIWDAALGQGLFDMDLWSGALLDVDSAAPGRVAWAVEVSQDHTWACIAAAGRRPDGAMHVQVLENHRGTAWIAGKVAELTREVWLSPNSPAGSLITPLKAAQVQVREVGTADYAKACGAFFDLYRERGLRHLGQPELTAAVSGARKRVSGDSWVFDRRLPDTDISPLTAATLAAWGIANMPTPGRGRVIALD